MEDLQTDIRNYDVEMGSTLHMTEDNPLQEAIENPLHGANDMDSNNNIFIDISKIKETYENKERDAVHIQFYLETLPGYRMGQLAVVMLLFFFVPLIYSLTERKEARQNQHSKEHVQVRFVESISILVFGALWLFAVRNNWKHEHPLVFLILVGQLLLMDPFDAIRRYRHTDYEEKSSGYFSLAQCLGLYIQTFALLLLIDKFRYPHKYREQTLMLRDQPNISLVQKVLMWPKMLTWRRWLAYLVTSSWAIFYFRVNAICSYHLNMSTKHCTLWNKPSTEALDNGNGWYIAYISAIIFTVFCGLYAAYLTYRALETLNRSSYMRFRYANLMLRVFIVPCVLTLVILVFLDLFYELYITTLFMPLSFAIMHLPPNKNDAEAMVDIMTSRAEKNGYERDSQYFNSEGKTRESPVTSRVSRIDQKDSWPFSNDQSPSSERLTRPVFIIEEALWATNFSTLVYFEHQRDSVINGRDLLTKNGAKYLKHLVVNRSDLVTLDSRKTLSRFINKKKESEEKRDEAELEEGEDNVAVYVILYEVDIDDGSNDDGENWNSVSSNKCLWVSFRGTMNVTQAQLDLDITQVAMKIVHHKTNEDRTKKYPHTIDGVCGHVHRGFWTGYSAIRLQLFEAITNIQESEKYSTVCCTGHSLGGAIAAIAALDIKLFLSSEDVLAPLEAMGNFNSNPPPWREKTFKVGQMNNVAVELYTLGAPRPGDSLFYQMHRRTVSNAFRIVYEGDIITGTPRSDCQGNICCRCCDLATASGCTRFCKKICAVREYKHVGHAVFLSSRLKGDLIVEPSSVEKFAYLRWARSPWSHRLKMYRGALENISTHIRNRVVKITSTGQLEIKIN